MRFRRALAIAIALGASLAREARAQRPQLTGRDWVYPSQPIGLYALREATSDELRWRTGLVALVPQGARFRLVGYWAYDPVDTNQIKSEDAYRRGDIAHAYAHLVDVPFAILDDGEALTHYAGDDLSGGFADGGVAALTRRVPTKRDSIAGAPIWTLVPLNSADAVAVPAGVYQVQGDSGSARWRGTVIYIETPMQDARGRWVGRVYVELSGETSIAYERDAFRSPNGRVDATVVDGDDTRIAISLHASAGGLSGEIVSIVKGHPWHIGLRGTKLIAGR